MDNIKNWIPIDSFNAARTTKYKGEYQIQRGYRGSTDTYDKWAIDSEWQNSARVPKKKKNSDEWQAFPVLIPLTKDKEKAIKIAEAIVEQLRRL